LDGPRGFGVDLPEKRAFRPKFASDKDSGRVSKRSSRSNGRRGDKFDDASAGKAVAKMIENAKAAFRGSQ